MSRRASTGAIEAYHHTQKELEDAELEQQDRAHAETQSTKSTPLHRSLSKLRSYFGRAAESPRASAYEATDGGTPASASAAVAAAAAAAAAAAPPPPPEPESDPVFREVVAHTIKPVNNKGPILRFFEGALGCVKHGEFASNEIRTAKYTVLTFVPVNLFEQFMRIANLYFLITAVLQLIPGLSPTSWFTTVMPLVMVLLINAIKEVADDYGRHKSDNDINNRTVLVLEEGGRETPVSWRDLAVGDIVKVIQDQEVPADLVFLSSSDTTNVCYVETANLDGETNLKIKNCFPKTQGKNMAEDFKAFAENFVVRCEQPNARLYVFDGAVARREAVSESGAAAAGSGRSPSALPLTADNLLLRGCSLRKTDWAIGLVVYTGQDSKIMMNRLPSPRKVTQLERHMNVLVGTMFVVLFVIAALMAMGEQIWQSSHNGRDWYLLYENKYPDFGHSFAGWIIAVIRWIILLNGIIPISLYVTLELVKVLQCTMLYNQDLEMYHKSTDTPFRCRTTNLNEDLGQVQYVLSDKTGTLTQNVMGFVLASMAGRVYGKRTCRSVGLPSPDHIDDDTPHSLALDADLLQGLGLDLHALAVKGRYKSSRSMRGHASVLRGAARGNADPELERFFINLAVCNTVVPAITDEGHFVYQASSPDEEALVTGAAFLGYRLYSRSTDKVVVEVLRTGQMLEYEMLAVLEFNSDRKRMSIIARCPDGKVRLFCKGADTMIMVRVASGQKLIGPVREHLEEMSQAGYRTLCVAEKELTDTEYARWAEQFAAASSALVDREGKVAACGERIESNMELLGATAVEDKLQDGVPEAIEALLKAGIGVWVLTGDKVETAISIALACRLFTEEMALVELRERDFEGAKGPGDDFRVLQKKHQEARQEQLRLEYELGSDCGKRIGLVVEGGALARLLNRDNAPQLIQLCCSCKSVVCCRVSPMQKAQVVKLVQKERKAIVLGIGDGANDVGMIQAAHIGCGISGREGRAAVLAADYSFAQFRYVARLVLLHGRAAYKRNCEVVLYAFYKNWIYSMVLMFFGFVTGFSSQPLFTSGLIATFNVFFTSMPTVAFAVLEQDVAKSTVLSKSILYSETMTATRKTFLVEQAVWIALASWHSLCIFFLPIYSMITPNRDGLFDDWVGAGTTVYTGIILTANLKLALRTRYWTWINHTVVWVSILIWWPFLYGYSVIWQVKPIDGTADMNGVAAYLYGNARFWLSGVLLAPAMSLLPDIAIRSYQQTFFPTLSQRYQEEEWREKLKKAAVRELGLTAAPQADGAAGPPGTLNPLSYRGQGVSNAV